MLAWRHLLRVLISGTVLFAGPLNAEPLHISQINYKANESIQPIVINRLMEIEARHSECANEFYLASGFPVGSRAEAYYGCMAESTGRGGDREHSDEWIDQALFVSGAGREGYLPAPDLIEGAGIEMNGVILRCNSNAFLIDIFVLAIYSHNFDHRTDLYRQINSTCADRIRTFEFFIIRGCQSNISKCYESELLLISAFYNMHRMSQFTAANSRDR